MATAGWAVSTAAASMGLVAEFDPTIQPTRASFWPFLFVAIALVLLMMSMVRHLRRARQNLAPERPQPPAIPESADPAAASSDTRDQAR